MLFSSYLSCAEVLRDGSSRGFQGFKTQDPIAAPPVRTQDTLEAAMKLGLAEVTPSYD
jgi:hypothetical protein